MRILIAEDDKVTRMRLEKTLGGWGFDVEAVGDGQAAWERLCGEDPPRLCIIDWLMPAMEGPELCRRVREKFPEEYFYLIILSAQQGVDNLIEGLSAGADDYVTKPFIGRELRSRIDVGVRVLGLEQMLAKKVHQLEAALEDVKQLRGLLPICSYCNKIRDDENHWEQVDTYITRRSNVEFSHSICPTCYEKHVQPMLDRESGRGI
ncbi:MAG: response regulator transcription factor [Kiritimatiellaceae bacterium]|nr:response regulator transcription factor [Kiritimatiellaceae bacterium]